MRRWFTDFLIGAVLGLLIIVVLGVVFVPSRPKLAPSRRIPEAQLDAGVE